MSSAFLGEVLRYMWPVRKGNQKELILRVRRFQELLDGFPSTFDFRPHTATHIEDHADRDRSNIPIRRLEAPVWNAGCYCPRRIDTDMSEGGCGRERGG
jgi:hypothetical protein